MTIYSRTYKTTDWKVWIYTPVSGKFRLDFSALDGFDVLSSTEGSLQEVALPIEQITITEGSPLNLNAITDLVPATASISLRTQGFTKSTMLEYYVGKKIAITVANADTAVTHSVFGQATPMFIGYITDANLSFNPYDTFQTINIQAQDSLQYVLNTPMAVTYGTSLALSSYVEDSHAALGGLNIYPEECTNYTSNGIMSSIGLYVPPVAGTETQTIGAWYQELYKQAAGYYIGFPTFSYRQSGSNYTFVREVNSYSYGATANYDPVIIASNKVMDVQFSNTNSTKPTSFNLTNNQGSVYSYGPQSSATLSNLSVWSDQMNCSVTDLGVIAQRVAAMSNYYALAEMTVSTAINNQTITYDSARPKTSGAIYALFYPTSYAQMGWQVQIDLSAYGFSSTESTAMVVGQEITVTPDNWITKYTLLRRR
jgi:hypothetical protein